MSNSNTISTVQFIATCLAILGLVFLPITVEYLLVSLVMFYVYVVLGISVTLHRYYTHKGFEFPNYVIKWLFTLIAILSGRGSPLGWVYVHRLHHAHTDTEKDPHSPHNLGLKLFGFKHIEPKEEKTKIFMIKDLLSKDQVFIHENYLGIILAFLVLLALIDVRLVFFVWVLPIAMAQLSQNCFNYFAHMYGYRNHETRDTSTNNIWLWPLIMGDAWHNNHHANPNSFSTQEKWWEIDPAAYIIKIIKK